MYNDERAWDLRGCGVHEGVGLRGCGVGEGVGSERAWGLRGRVACRWLSVRLEMLGICIVFGAALFVAVLLPSNAGLAGLALTSALNLTGHTLALFCSALSCTAHCSITNRSALQEVVRLPCIVGCHVTLLLQCSVAVCCCWQNLTWVFEQHQDCAKQ